METKSVRVMVLTCSTRPGALGPVVAEWLVGAIGGEAARLGVELVAVAVSELGLPFLDEEEHPSSGIYRHEHTRRWSELVESVDGVIAVTPEYNYGMPATLKNALDYLGREWAWKPIGFVSYGNTSAGTRSVQHAKQVVTTLKLVPLGATVAIRIAEVVEGGRLRADSSRDRAAVGVLGELVRVAQALRPMREAVRAVGKGPIPGTYLRRLTSDDSGQVAVLQRACWVDEAFANESLDIPALHESVEDVREWLGEWETTGLWLDGRLLGMVRAKRDGDEWHIGRLGVVADLRGRGVGRWLLRYAEERAPEGIERVRLTTGAKSVANIGLYRSEGFVVQGGDGFTTDLVKEM